MKTLYLADLDGTLLDANAELTEYTKNTINRLVEKGMHFGVATARTAATAKYIVAGLKVSIPMAMMSGVYYYDLEKDTYSNVLEIPKNTRRSMLDIIKKHHLPGFIYVLENNEQVTFYENLESTASRDFLEERTRKFNKKFVKIDSFDEIIDRKTIYYSVSDKEDKLRPVYEELQKLDGLNIEFYRDVYSEGYWYLEAFNDKASKYNAAKYLKETYGYDKVVGFGDNLVDISLFKACDESYAVDNAKDDVKKHATGVIDSNVNDGVAKWLLENAEF